MMKVKDVMTTPVVTIGPDAPLKEAIEEMLRADVSALPVTEPDGTLLGIVSEGDVLAKEAGHEGPRSGFRRFLASVLIGETPLDRKARARTVREAMTSRVETAAPDETLTAVARRMLTVDRKRLPVVEDGRVIGIVARADILRVFARTDAAIEASVSGLLARCMYGPPEHEINPSVREGVVTLSGWVLYESDRRVAEGLVRGVDGVIGVDNRLMARERDPQLTPSRLRKETWWW